MSYVNPTVLTWKQLANEQAYNAFSQGTINSLTRLTEYDSIYDTFEKPIVEQIFRFNAIAQRWSAIGSTISANEYPGIIEEIAIKQRKGEDYPLDQIPGQPKGAFPLYQYKFVPETFFKRYHFGQVRRSYKYTLTSQPLKGYAFNRNATIGNIANAITQNAVNDHNLYTDALRKHLLATVTANYGTRVTTGVAIDDFATLTQEQALTWLNMLDNLYQELADGTTAYNNMYGTAIATPTTKVGAYMRTPKSQLQIIIRRNWWLNVQRRAYPDLRNTWPFDNIMPENVILIDTFGDDEIYDASGAVLSPTFEAGTGMNQLNWDNTMYFGPANPDLQFVIMDKRCMSIRSNYVATLTAAQDIDYLMTPGRHHLWYEVLATDMLPIVAGVNPPAVPPVTAPPTP